MPIDWKDLVERAKDSDADFERLISKLEPLFWVVAKHLSYGRLTDDLVQAARIKVWESLSKADLTRLETIEQFLITAGINKMRDEIKRRSWRLMPGCDDETISAVSPISAKRYLFHGLLSEYEKYIRRNGSFKGSHKHMAKKYRASVWTMRQRFHRAAHQFLKELEK